MIKGNVPGENHTTRPRKRDAVEVIDEQEMDEKIRKLRLIDDTLMKAVFAGFKPGAEVLIRACLERDDINVVRVRAQREYHNTVFREIRIDIDAIDREGNRYDIEVQREAEEADPRRALYHLSFMTNQSLKKAKDFRALPQMYVIFFNESDYFGTGRPMERFSWRNDDTGEPFSDQAHIIYVNGNYRDTGTLLGGIVHDLFCTDPRDMVTPVLAERVSHFKESVGGKDTMVGFERDGYNRGIVAGRAEGETKGFAKSIINLMRSTKKSLNEALNMLGVSEEERPAVIEQVNAMTASGK